LQTVKLQQLLQVQLGVGHHAQQNQLKCALCCAVGVDASTDSYVAVRAGSL